jgi:hypothetical protein
MIEKYELLINGDKYVLTFSPDSEAPSREVDTGMAHLVLGDTVVGDYAYNRTSFVRNPFFMIKPV